VRKVVDSMFVTLDGIMEAPDKRSFPYWNDEIAEFKFDELFACDALLLGRVTYADEYRLLVHPIVRGIGKRLFLDGSQATLRLTDTKPFSSGVVLLQYRPQALEK